MGSRHTGRVGDAALTQRWPYRAPPSAGALPADRAAPSPSTQSAARKTTPARRHAPRLGQALERQGFGVEGRANAGIAQFGHRKLVLHAKLGRARELAQRLGNDPLLCNDAIESRPHQTATTAPRLKNALARPDVAGAVRDMPSGRLHRHARGHVVRRLVRRRRVVDARRLRRARLVLLPPRVQPRARQAGGRDRLGPVVEAEPAEDGGVLAAPARLHLREGAVRGRPARVQP